MTELMPPRPRPPADQLLPAHVVALLRQELPSLCGEIMTEISRGVPEYAPLINGAYREPARSAVASNVSAFIDQLSSPVKGSPTRDRLCRELGELQATSGQGMTRLEAAIRIGIRVGWRRASLVFQRHRVPDAFHYLLADRLFEYVEELTALARDGYQRAMAERRVGREQHRRHLSRELLTGAGLPALTRAAARAEWTLPAEVTVLVTGRGALTDSERLDPDVLLDTAGPSTVLVVPGGVEDAREDMVARAVRRAVVVAGPTTPLTHAPESLRLARRAAHLAEAGVIGRQRLVRAEEHLLTLWLAAETDLGTRLEQRQLSAFDGLSPSRRRRMLETLACWLETHGDAHAMGERLGLHPQSVRHRVRVLRAMVGPSLEDPEWRMCTALTLRRVELTERLATQA